MAKMSISEKQLEDWICQDPQHTIEANSILIGRQIPLTHGRLDILLWECNRIAVVELKIRPLREEDIGQVARYACDVAHIIGRIGSQQKPKPPEGIRSLRYSIYEDKWYDHHGNQSYDPIDAMLVGPSIDPRTLAAAVGAGITVRLWNYNQDTGKLTLSFPDYEVLCADVPPYPSWALKLNDFIQDLCVEEAERDFGFEIKELFGKYKDCITLENEG